MICSYCCAKWGWKFRNLLASAGPLILTALRKGVGPRCYVTVGNLVPIQWPADAFFSPSYAGFAPTLTPGEIVPCDLSMFAGRDSASRKTLGRT